MDGLITLVSVFGAMLLAFAYAFVLSGEWLPTVRDWLVPDTRGSRILSNIGYTAALLATVWTIMFIANRGPASDRSHHPKTVDGGPATASPASSDKKAAQTF